MKEISHNQYEYLLERYTNKAYELCTDENDFHNYMSHSLVPLSMINTGYGGNFKHNFFTIHFSIIPCLKLQRKHHVICLGSYIPNLLVDNSPAKYYIDFHKVGECKLREYNG
jgi:hypothetical protein